MTAAATVVDWPTLLSELVGLWRITDLPDVPTFLPTPEQIGIIRKADGQPSHVSIQLASYADLTTWTDQLGGPAHDPVLTVYRNGDGEYRQAVTQACIYRGWWVHLDANAPCPAEVGAAFLTTVDGAP